MRLTADKIEENNAAKQRNSDKAPKSKRGTNPNSLKNLIAPWKPGESGNAGGKPGYDVAAKIARQVLENNETAIYEALTGALLKGNPYAFKELAERGYGKLTDKIQVTTDAEITARLLAGRKRVNGDSGEPASTPGGGDQ